MKWIRKLWVEHRIATIAFAMALVLALFFAGRLTYFLVYWSDPAHRNQPIENWMTIGYVARSYGVPRDQLAQAIAIKPQPGQRKTLEQLAADRGVDVEFLKTELSEAVNKLQSQNGK